MVQLSQPYVTTGKTISLTVLTFVGKVMFLLFNMLSRFVLTFFPGSKHLLISWLRSPSAVISEPKKIKYIVVYLCQSQSPNSFHPSSSRPRPQPWGIIFLGLNPSRRAHTQSILLFPSPTELPGPPSPCWRSVFLQPFSLAPVSPHQKNCQASRLGLFPSWYSLSPHVPYHRPHCSALQLPGYCFTLATKWASVSTWRVNDWANEWSQLML